MKGKVLIVGGGAVGTCIALQAAKRYAIRSKNPSSSSRRANWVLAPPAARVPSCTRPTRAGPGGPWRATRSRLYHHIQSTTGRSLGLRRTGVLAVVEGSDKQGIQLHRDLEMQVGLGIKAHGERGRDPSDGPGIEVEDDAIGRFEARWRLHRSGQGHRDLQRARAFPRRYHPPRRHRPGSRGR
ncbi:MAG: FAD-dependent oxidoreductase [Planctomycetota bacterium]